MIKKIPTTRPSISRWAAFVFLAVVVAFSAALMTGCESRIEAKPDQCLRRELFKECMAALPAGPVATKYNDWDEVVQECDSGAYYKSLRAPAVIKPECRTF